MAKRSKDTLTGGTGDVNPQYACIQVVPAVSATGVGSNAVPIVLPVLPNLGGTQDTAQVVELLKVDFDFGGLPTPTGTQLQATTSLRLAYNAATASAAITAGTAHIGNPLIITENSTTYQSYFVGGAVGAGVAFATVSEHNRQVDLTDQAGHGLLVAVPTIWFGLGFNGWPVNSAPGGPSCRVTYRLKRVRLIEYIGIVQQQSGPQI